VSPLLLVILICGESLRLLGRYALKEPLAKNSN
jgi:hypothetical protein